MEDRQDISPFKMPIGTRNEFFEIYRQHGHAPSKRCTKYDPRFLSFFFFLVFSRRPRPSVALPSHANIHCQKERDCGSKVTSGVKERKKLQPCRVTPMAWTDVDRVQPLLLVSQEHNVSLDTVGGKHLSIGEGRKEIIHTVKFVSPCQFPLATFFGGDYSMTSLHSSAIYPHL